MLGGSRSPRGRAARGDFQNDNCLRHAGARMPLAGLPHANKYDRKDSPAEKEMRVRTREHVRNEGSRRFKSAPLRHTVWHASLHYGEAMKLARGARFTRGRGRGECQRQRLSVKIA